MGGEIHRRAHVLVDRQVLADHTGRYVGDQIAGVDDTIGFNTVGVVGPGEFGARGPGAGQVVVPHAGETQVVQDVGYRQGGQGGAQAVPGDHQVPVTLQPAEGVAQGGTHGLVDSVKALVDLAVAGRHFVVGVLDVGILVPVIVGLGTAKCQV